MNTVARALRMAGWAMVVLIGLTAGYAAGQEPAAASPAPAAAPSQAGQTNIQTMLPGESFTLGDRLVTVLRLDIVPFVENEMSRAYVFDRYGNPKLERLRLENNLDAVIAPGRDEFDRQLLLMEWVQFQIEYGDPKELGGLRDALKILELSKREQKLYCSHFAALLISCAASLGWVCRPIDVAGHSFTELWSNEHRKWILFDPNSNFYISKGGVLLNTYEARQEWFKNHCQDCQYLRARERRRAPEPLEKYNLVSFIPNTDLMDSPMAKDRAFVIRDELTKDASERGSVIKNPAVDPYFPINQAALSLAPQGAALAVKIQTLTPNFKTFRVRIDGGPWTDSAAGLTWTLHDGANRLEARSVNLFGMEGPVSTVELNAVPAAEAGRAPIIMPAASFSAQGGGSVHLREPEGDVSPGYVHLWFTKGHWLEWAIEGAEAGEYDLALRYSGRYVALRELRVNGQPAKGLESVSLQPTRSWAVFGDVRLPVRVQLAQGRNVVRLTCLDDVSLCLSRLLFSASDKKDIVVEATDLTEQGGGQAQTILAPVGGYFREWDGNGRWLEWTVADAPAGQYDVFLRYATMYETPCELQVNGSVAAGLESFVMPLCGGWTDWMEGKLPAPITLRQGRNVLRMTAKGDMGLNMNALRLVGPGGKEITVNATALTGESEGKKVRVWAPSRHGSIYDWSSDGQWLEWTIPNAKAGQYELALRYATEEQAPRQVQLNGQVVQGLESFALEQTGTWQMWREQTLPARLSLKEGRNVLRLTSRAGGLNLDEIRLTPVQKQ